jgi:hypothetical protein
LPSIRYAMYTSPMATTKRKCAFCDNPATQSIQCREYKRWQFLCMDKKCWDAYYEAVAARKEGK